MRKHEILHLLLFLGALCFLGSCSDNDKYETDDDYIRSYTDREIHELVGDVKKATFTQYDDAYMSSNELVKGDPYYSEVYEFNEKGMATKRTHYKYKRVGNELITRKTYEEENVFANNNRLLERTSIFYTEIDTEQTERVFHYECSYDNSIKKWVHYHYEGDSKETLQPTKKEVEGEDYYENFTHKPVTKASLARANEWEKNTETTFKKVLEKDSKDNIVLEYFIRTQIYPAYGYESIFSLRTTDITYYDGTKSEKKKEEEITEKPIFVAQRMQSNNDSKLKSRIEKSYSNSIWDEQNQKIVLGNDYSTKSEKYSEAGYLLEYIDNYTTALYEVDSKGRITKQTEKFLSYNSTAETMETTIEYTNKQAIAIERRYLSDGLTNDVVYEKKEVYNLTKDGFANDYSYQSYHPKSAASSRTIAKDEDFEEKPSIRRLTKIEKDKYENTTTHAIIYQYFDQNGKVTKSEVRHHWQYEYQYY